jgi:hypothetical protein
LSIRSILSSNRHSLIIRQALNTQTSIQFLLDTKKVPMFPEPVNSIASALTLLDYAVKFLRFLSPPVRNAMQEAQVELSCLSANSSPSAAQDILSNALRKQMTITDANIASRDITIIMEILLPLVDKLEGDLKKEYYPEYGWALYFTINAVYQKLVSWGCFEIFSHHDGYLDAPYTTIGLKQCTNLMARVKTPWIRWGKVYFYCRTKWDTPVNRLYLGNHNIGDMGWVDFEGHNVSIEAKEYHLKSSDLELIVNGLVNDTIYYSRLLRGEITAGQSVLDRLKRKLKSS